MCFGVVVLGGWNKDNAAFEFRQLRGVRLRGLEITTTWNAPSAEFTNDERHVGRVQVPPHITNQICQVDAILFGLLVIDNVVEALEENETGIVVRLSDISNDKRTNVVEIFKKILLEKELAHSIEIYCDVDGITRQKK